MPFRILGFCLAIAACAAASATPVRIAAQTVSDPKFMAAPPGSPTPIIGLCIDILRSIERIDPTLQFIGDQTWVPAARIDVQMAHGALDAACAMLKTKDRLAHFSFIEPPLMAVQYMLAVRAGDHVNVASMADIVALEHDNVVLGVHGMGAATRLAGIPGLHLDTGTSTARQNLEKLVAGRGRFFYYRSPGLKSIIRNFCMEKKVRVLPAVMASESLYLMVGESIQPDTVERLRNAVGKLQGSGELARLQAKWEEWALTRSTTCPPTK